MSRTGRLIAIAVGFAWPLAFLGVTYGWPVTVIARRSVEGGLGALGATLADDRLIRVAVVTVLQAVVTTALTAVAGIPAAYCHARLRFPGRRLLWLAVAVPFVLPTVVLAAGVLSAVGPLGWEGGSWPLVIAAQVAANLAVVVRTVGSRLAVVDPAIEDAAAVLGRSRLAAAWLSVRAVGPAIRSALVVVFLFCLTSFGIVVVLGGGPVTTLEVEIWYQTTRLLRLDVAATLAAAQLLVVVAVLVLYQRSTRERPTTGLLISMPRPARGPIERLVVAGTVSVEATVILVPIVALVLRSLRVGSGWGLDNYRNLGRTLEGTTLAVAPLEAVGNSLWVGTAASLVALAVAVPASWLIGSGARGSRVLDVALMLPLATSAATVGFGILVAYRSPPLDLRGSPWAVPLAQAGIAAPLAVRVLAPVVAAIDRTMLGAAATLGAGPWRIARTLIWPATRGALGLAAGLAFAVSLGEFGATSFLARSDAPTLPQLVTRLLGRPGPIGAGQGYAVAVLLVVVTAGVFAAADRIGRGRSLQF